MRVLVAFDKFKDALSASAACEIAASELRSAHPDWSLDLCPLADGGDGFAEILTRAAGGRREAVHVTGPRGGEVVAHLGLVAASAVPAGARAMLAHSLAPGATGGFAVIDLASASGLAHLAPAERDPWRTSTLGTGELIRAAAAPRPAAILLGIGGSATNDLGLGALAALGVRAEARDGRPVSLPTPRVWPAIAHLHGRVASDLPPLFVACDVTNPLLGPHGCAAIFGPQKGLHTADLAVMERESERLARLLCAHTGQPWSLADVPGAGAAGGFAFGLMAAAGAVLVPGFDLVAAWLDLDRRIAAADLVLTGEGCYDATSLGGKGPGAVVARALAARRRVEVFAGRVEASPDGNEALHALSPSDWPLSRALAETPTQLRAAVRRALG